MHNALAVCPVDDSFVNRSQTFELWITLKENKSDLTLHSKCDIVHNQLVNRSSLVTL